ncbi:MAG: DUF2796 domain-containing protein [Deltaproteobacteria bacterium]|nr:DUF2796 domain-containing protein [Deltaproteobacteria bacterium]
MFRYTASLGLGFLLLAVQALSAAEKRHAHSHVHGTAEMNIVVDGKTVAVEFRSPAEDVIGFEHEAKSDAERKKRDAALDTVKDRFGEMVVFDKKLGCAPGAAEVTVVQTDAAGKEAQQGKGDAKKSGEHREVRARQSFTCQSEPGGSRVRFGVSKLFPRIDQVKVQVLSGAKQAGATIKKDKGELGL